MILLDIVGVILVGALIWYLISEYIDRIVDVEVYACGNAWRNVYEDDTDYLWGIIEGANRRRKKIEYMLQKEQRANERWHEKAIEFYRKYLEATVENEKLQSRNRELAASVVDAIIKDEPVADVLVDRLRKKGIT
jgi:hypothetical protein